MQLTKNSVHVWRRSLLASEAEVTENFNLLSLDEQKRAQRFKFAHHRRRFIIARASLRLILSQYLAVLPCDIIFQYAEKDKPYLANNHLQFNLAHSEDYALYAIRLEQAIGIDLEYVGGHNIAGLAQRYFTQDEQQQLNNLPEAQQMQTFYKLWTRKEALLKADGRGLGIPLSSFSVSAQDRAETITLAQVDWLLFPIDAPMHYQAALATHPSVTKLCSLEIFPNGHTKLLDEYDIMLRYPLKK